MKNLFVLMVFIFVTSQVIAAQADFAQTSINKDKKKDKKKNSGGDPTASSFDTYGGGFY